MSSDPPLQRWKRRRLPGFDYANPDCAYFVTVRALPGTAPFGDERLAAVVLASLHWLRRNRGVAVYAYCLMPDHLHLLIRLAESGPPLGSIIGAFKRFTTHESWGLGYQGALWQPRFHDHVLRPSENAGASVTYILANPVRKGLVESAEQYGWSGLLDPM